MPVPLIKICGITNLRDAIASIEAGADSLGFVCDEDSPRFVAPETFAAISVALPAHVNLVAVFYKGSAPQWIREGQPLLLRFHQIEYWDDEIWPMISNPGGWDASRRMKAFSLQGTADLLRIAAYRQPACDYLVNAHIPGDSSIDDPEEYGWKLARQVRQYGKRIYLAGGLTPNNVARAIHVVRPHGVDVTVGVESQPGIKDEIKLRDFVQAARSSYPG
jgi:phosphoribosylanthranilate isomerase